MFACLYPDFVARRLLLADSSDFIASAVSYQTYPQILTAYIRTWHVYLVALSVLSFVSMGSFKWPLSFKWMPSLTSSFSYDRPSVS